MNSSHEIIVLEDGLARSNRPYQDSLSPGKSRYRTSRVLELHMYGKGVL